MLRRIRELREKQGPLHRLMMRGGRLAKFVRSRPLLQKAFEDFKPDILDPEEFRESLVEDIGNAKEQVLIYSPFTHAEIIARESC